ncbi:Monofunctional biosynthetic peptidoglycan transglycosylase [compost metagenome]
MAIRNRTASAARGAASAGSVLNPLRWLGYLLGCVVAGVLAMQLYFFVQIASWQYVNPSSTTFMRAERWRLCGFNLWRCGLEREWVPYERISRNLKRAVIASEDSGFVNHPGYELDAMLDAWERNKKRGRIVRGGSTITGRGRVRRAGRGAALLPHQCRQAQHRPVRAAGCGAAGAQVLRQEGVLRQRAGEFPRQGGDHRAPDGRGDVAGLRFCSPLPLVGEGSEAAVASKPQLNHPFLLKYASGITADTAISAIAHGYPPAQSSSGMNLKFMP